MLSSRAQGDRAMQANQSLRECPHSAQISAATMFVASTTTATTTSSNPFFCFFLFGSL
jgi:hypothetical protein